MTDPRRAGAWLAACIACAGCDGGGAPDPVDPDAGAELREPTITVVAATYGRNVGAVSGNITPVVAARCDDRQTCTFDVDTAELFPAPPACPAAGLLDVAADHPACFFLDHVHGAGVMPAPVGCATGLCPGALVDRLEAATYVVRAAFGEPSDFSTTPRFEDVTAASPFFPYVQKMADEGITVGCTATSYQAGCAVPQVTRAQLAVFLMRARYGERAGGPQAFLAPTAAMFTDVPPEHSAFREIQQLAALGITAGVSATEFAPDVLITKAEAATFVARTFDADQVPIPEPLPGRAKDLVIEYRCGVRRELTAGVAADAAGATVALSCAE